MAEFKHRSVMLDETIEGLRIIPEGIYADGTLGGAGHSFEIAKRLTTGRLIGFDQDGAAIEAATERLAPYKDRVTIIRNNYETMIREFMKSNSKKDFAIITNMNDKLKEYLESTLHFSSDSRIKFVGTVYDKEMLKKIRESAYGYFHGHEVGGTNPSLLEALGSTELNLLLDVGFNKEVGEDAALYWKKDDGSLSSLIEQADNMDPETRKEFGVKAKERIRNAYSWKFIGDEYMRVWAR